MTQGQRNIRGIHFLWCRSLFHQLLLGTQTESDNLRREQAAADDEQGAEDTADERAPGIKKSSFVQ